VKSDILDIRMVLHRSTDSAVHVSEDGDEGKTVWLPLKCIEISPAKSRAAGLLPCVDLQIPQWLAEKKRLV
jgi:hypothetical protein